MRRRRPARHPGAHKPTGNPEPPLSKATDWVNVTRGGKRYRRETNTMPQWAGSCWYYLRYLDPRNDRVFADPEKLKRWLPVDLYVGGAEHAVRLGLTGVHDMGLSREEVAAYQQAQVRPKCRTIKNMFERGFDK